MQGYAGIFHRSWFSSLSALFHTGATVVGYQRGTNKIKANLRSTNGEEGRIESPAEPDSFAAKQRKHAGVFESDMNPRLGKSRGKKITAGMITILRTFSLIAAPGYPLTSEPLSLTCKVIRIDASINKPYNYGTPRKQPLGLE
ncbi:uncharacterized protein BDR25DRAFT_359629 [Lindgomyces ingoldianus]|uniref:Uncharacterized protein n=1 Tax=Lindgomyces ingoldianus TaxID=673940 RepID=A0ACB6QH52_9PLEO|nr:uncharacterized protein BDR25DRAFT_359629 [Lindgomyces ingoldianus]KAF2466261.1 hypothetical protein BDR25DRAFT_359629 [Lindgomyces ingoldianus]